MEETTLQLFAVKACHFAWLGALMTLSRTSSSGPYAGV
jgi:hypothetical protein